jgi:hypothetical protein
MGSPIEKLFDGNVAISPALQSNLFDFPHERVPAGAIKVG